MPADRADLERRIALATPPDTVRGVIFRATSGLVRRHLGEDAARACDPAREKRNDFFSYPIADYLRLAWAAADALERRLGSPEAVFFAIGEAAVEDLARTLFGRTVLALAAGSPRQVLEQIPGGYKATVGYGERRVTWLSPRSARVSYARDFLVPGFHRGILTAALHTTGARDVTADARVTGPLDLEVEVGWT
jgi:uncharacterized protein (TIGR02265 family)